MFLSVSNWWSVFGVLLLLILEGYIFRGGKEIRGDQIGHRDKFEAVSCRGFWSWFPSIQINGKMSSVLRDETSAVTLPRVASPPEESQGRFISARTLIFTPSFPKWVLRDRTLTSSTIQRRSASKCRLGMFSQVVFTGAELRRGAQMFCCGVLWLPQRSHPAVTIWRFISTVPQKDCNWFVGCFLKLKYRLCSAIFP